MKLNDVRIQAHLIHGGKIKIPAVRWGYVKLNGNLVCWYDAITDKFVACVDTIYDVASKDWEILTDEDTVC